MSKFFDRFTYLTTKYLKIGSVQINEISTDGTFAGNSDLCVPTEKAVKTYVDLNAPAVSAHTLTGANHTVTGLSTGHFLKATGATTFGFAAHGLTATDVAAVPSSYLDTDGTLAANSDTKVATQKALKTYADTKISEAIGAATGDILYYDGANWVALTAGASGEVLTMSAEGIPAWEAA